MNNSLLHAPFVVETSWLFQVVSEFKHGQRQSQQKRHSKLQLNTIWSCSQETLRQNDVNGLEWVKIELNERMIPKIERVPLL